MTKSSHKTSRIDSQGPKRFGLLQVLAPTAMRFGLLVNSKNPTFELTITEARAAVASMGRTVEILAVNAADELDAVFAGLGQKGIDAIMITPDPMFYGARTRIAVLAARHAVPAISWDRALAEAGGLMSYGSSVADMNRQVGIYAGRVLNGEKPADMPVLQPTRFEFVINLATAKALGIEVPPGLLAIADEVID